MTARSWRRPRRRIAIAVRSAGTVAGGVLPRPRWPEQLGIAVLWWVLELGGYAFLCAGLFDVWRPLGLIAIGLVLIRVGDSRGATTPAPPAAGGRTP